MLCKCSGKYIDIYFILKITFYFTDLCPFADPIDRMRVWLFFLVCLFPFILWSPCHLCMRSLTHVLDFPLVVTPLLVLLLVCGVGSSSLPLPTFLFVSLLPFRSSTLSILCSLCVLFSMSWPSLLWFLLWGLFRVFFPSMSRFLSLYSLSFGSVG